MISKKELDTYAKITGLNLGQAEKDYFQNLLLFVVYQIHGNDIVFKGGTALKKCYGLDRFSEDLDFTCAGDIDMEKIENMLDRFKVDLTKESRKYENGLKVTMKIKGPLYIGVPQSQCRFIIDFSFRENVILPPAIKTIGRFLEEIPSFDVFVMQEKEILAEKIRAILSRKKARDVYDLWFLLSKGVEADEALIEEKFKYYNQSWDIKEFDRRLGDAESIWVTELRHQVRNLPDFSEAKNLILKEAKKWSFQ